MEQRNDKAPTDKQQAAGFLAIFSGLIRFPYDFLGRAVTAYNQTSAKPQPSEAPELTSGGPQWLKGLKPSQSPPDKDELALLDPEVVLKTGFLAAQEAWSGVTKRLGDVDDLKPEAFGNLKSEAEKALADYDESCLALLDQLELEAIRREKASGAVLGKAPDSAPSPADLELLGAEDPTLALYASKAKAYEEASARVVHAMKAPYPAFNESITGAGVALGDWGEACKQAKDVLTKELERRTNTSEAVLNKTPDLTPSSADLELLGAEDSTLALCASKAKAYAEASAGVVDAMRAPHEAFNASITKAHDAFNDWIEACRQANDASTRESERRRTVLEELKSAAEVASKEPEHSATAPAKILESFRSQPATCGEALLALANAAAGSPAMHAVAEKNARAAIDRLERLSQQLRKAIETEAHYREETCNKIENHGLAQLDSDQLAAIPDDQPEYPALVRCVNAFKDFDKKRDELVNGRSQSTADAFRKLEHAAQVAMRELRSALNVFRDTVNIYNKRIYKERAGQLARKQAVSKEAIGLLPTDSPIRLRFDELTKQYEERMIVFRSEQHLPSFEEAQNARDLLDECAEEALRAIEREQSRRREVVNSLAMPDTLPSEEELSILKNGTEPKTSFMLARNRYPGLLEQVRKAEKSSSTVFQSASSQAEEALDKLKRSSAAVSEAAEQAALEELPGQLLALRGEFEQFADFVVKAEAHDFAALESWARKLAPTVAAENFKQLRSELNGAFRNVLLAFPMVLQGEVVFRPSLQSKMKAAGLDLVRARLEIMERIESQISKAAIRKVGDLEKLRDDCNRAIAEFQGEQFGASGKILHTKAWFKGKDAAFGLMLPRAIGPTGGERLNEVVKLFKGNPSQLRGEKDHPWARHIHVKGDGSDNVVLDSRNNAVLGYCGHISSAPTDRTNLRDHNKLVAKAGDPKVSVAILGGLIYEIEE